MNKIPPQKTHHITSPGSQRITSKIGSGFALAPVHPLDDKLNQLENDQGVTPYDNYEEFGDALWDMMGNGYDCADINRENINFEPQLECMETLAEERGEEAQIYFYHPDHLGSSSFITDASGDAHQHLQYMPFGESFISQRINWATRYTFSAKEKDKNTGYHYFGARYYDSEVSVWLSVDPMASGFPGISPYAYCYNSPTMFVDPWGLAATKYVDEGNNEIENVDDGKDQTVQVNREQYKQTKEDFQKGGGDLSNREDAKRFTKNYEQASNVSDDIVFERVGENGNYSSIKNIRNYKYSTVSESDFHNAKTRMNGIGVLGGYYVSFYTEIAKNNKNGKKYLRTSATAYAPYAEKVSDRINYFGTTELIFNGKTQSKRGFNISTGYNRSYIPFGHTWLGYSYMDIPQDVNAKMRITISYNVYKYFYGHAYPVKPYRYIIKGL